jgi:AraC-like DNA-binding protein
VLARLSELMFVETLRRYIASLPDDRRGWLSGLRDPIVGMALAALHERPARAWTLEDLASEVGASRSVLAERFTDLVGVPPMHYLQEWRMQLTAELLSSTSAALSEIAERVGYGSEAALSRAFKRLVGVAPGRWREGERVAVSSPKGT